jgi:hypothetical protein
VTDTENAGNALKTLLDDYRSQGFRIFVEPAGMPDSGIDAIATKGNRVLAFQVRSPRGDDDSGTRVFAADEPDIPYVDALLREVESLLRPETPVAAVLVAWTAAEAALRAIGRRHGMDISRMPPRQLMSALAEKSVLTEQQYEKLITFSIIRDTVAHGLRPVDLPLEYIGSLVQIVRELLGRPQQNNGGNALFTIVAGQNLEGMRGLWRLIDDANRVLADILGQSAGLVSAEWDRAEDDRGRTVVMLTLSDFTGKVTATFAPEELGDHRNIQIRLRRIWGDLLQLRTQKHREELSSKRPEAV